MEKQQHDERLAIKKTVWVDTHSNRRYSVDVKPGTEGRPDYFVLTEHKRDGKRHKVVILQPDLEKIIRALKEAASEQ